MTNQLHTLVSYNVLDDDFVNCLVFCNGLVKFFCLKFFKIRKF